MRDKHTLMEHCFAAILVLAAIGAFIWEHVDLTASRMVPPFSLVFLLAGVGFWWCASTSRRVRDLETRLRELEVRPPTAS